MEVEIGNPWVLDYGFGWRWRWLGFSGFGRGGDRWLRWSFCWRGLGFFGFDWGGDQWCFCTV